MPPITPATKKPEILILFALCLAFSWAHWLRLDTFWGDPGRWMFEFFRYYRGEWPYRDYGFFYPPLGPVLFGWAMNWLGPTFETLQLTVDAISTALVLLFYATATRLFSRWSAFAVTLAFLLAYASFGSTLALFSLFVYLPNMLIGVVGVLILLTGCLDRLAGRRGDVAYYLAFALGGAVCWGSKPEFWAAFACTWIAMVFLDLQQGRPWRRVLAVQIGAGLAGTIPALIGYAWVIRNVSWPLFDAAMNCFGVTAMMCPMWPTGVSLLGVSTAIAQGWTLLFLLKVIAAVRSGTLSRPLAIRAAMLLVVSSVLYAFYVPALHLPRPYVGLLASQKYAGFMYFLGTSTAWMPPMWLSFTLLPFLAYRVYTRRRNGQLFSYSYAALIVLVTAVFALELRGLFNYVLDELPKTSQTAAGVIFLTVPYLFKTFVPAFGRHPVHAWAPRTSTLVLTVLLAYGGMRFAGSLKTWPSNDYRFSTRSGNIRLSDKAAMDMYEYVAARLHPGDQILDVDYGGGVNFATQTSSPAFTTQFTVLKPDEGVLLEDARRTAQNPPRFVIAHDSPSFGVQYGVCANCGCMFPKIPWRSTKLNCDPNKKFPVIEYIRQNYHRVVAFGGRQLLVRN